MTALLLVIAALLCQTAAGVSIDSSQILALNLSQASAASAPENNVVASPVETIAKGQLSFILHFSHEGGRELLTLMQCGFDQTVTSPGHIPTRETVFKTICGEQDKTRQDKTIAVNDFMGTKSDTRNWEQLRADGHMAIEIERNAGSPFPTALAWGCPAEVQFITVLRDPVRLFLSRRFRRYGADPDYPRFNNAHVFSLLTFSGDLKIARCCPDEPLDLGKAKGVLSKLSSVCITEEFQNCVLILARAMKVQLSQEEFDNIENQYLNRYLSENHNLDFVKNFTEKASPQQKKMLQRFVEDNSLDRELYAFARKVSANQFRDARVHYGQRLQMRSSHPRLPSALQRLNERLEMYGSVDEMHGSVDEIGAKVSHHIVC